MAITPFNLSLLGADLHQRRQPDAAGGGGEAGQGVPEARTATPPSRPSRRPTSYYNTFQTTCAVSHDEPPTYAAATRHSRRPASEVKEGKEILPPYSCTVGAEAKLLLNLESISPLHGTCEGEWREVYAVVRGTMISFHRVKDGGAGKLLRSYTLQHAEVGLASDAEHTILVPQTRLAHLLPSGARKRAWQKDQNLFNPVKQTILRLRAETDQILLADSSEECINQLIQILGAAIDIAHAIDERSIARQCTVPRRRRRTHRPQFQGDLADPSLLAEQERIFQQMYPSFAGNRPGFERTVTADLLSPGPQSPSREEEEVDFSMIREEAAAPASTLPVAQSDETSRPNNIRQTTQSTINSVISDDMVHATPTSNFDIDGKWHPPHLRSAAQVQRYIRRCMPVLLADSPRASDIVIADGKRMKINWRMELLEQWELQPPTYKAHEFDREAGLARSVSQRSTTGSATQAAQLSSSSVLADDSTDQICPAETALENLHLAKVTSNSGLEKAAVSSPTTTTNNNTNDFKSRTPQQLPQDVHGVVFCF